MKKSSEREHQSKDEQANQGWLARREAAIRHYHELALCPIPLRWKAPYHKGWQTPERYKGISTEEVLQMFHPNDNVGLLCGIQMQDGRYLIGIEYDDLTMRNEHDGNQDIEWLTKGSIVKTGSGKLHHHVVSDNPKAFVFAGIEDPTHGGEIQGSRRQCVAPPSIHPDKKEEYQWTQED